MTKVVNVIPKDDYTLEIELENHHKIIYDMKNRLKSTRFCELDDISVFKAVRIENGDTLLWNSLCQITINEIINTIER